MSAIAGLYRADGANVGAATLHRMVNAMAHCGLDGAAVWCGGEMGLGHRMLHTTQESLQEELPLAVSDLVITADARIDNREELIGKLELSKGPASLADSEIILASYRAWGEGCLEHLVGDFAFAIWDGAKRRLFCARDHFGIRPFYYHHQPGRLFAFGTEIKALLQVPGVPQRLNEVRVADFLATMREDPENTIYEDIWRLPAAHALSIDADGLRSWRYYTLAPATDVASDATDAEYAARFRELFAEAVRVRLRSAFPIGSELSGGMDSSSVTCMARALLDEGTTLHTFSVVFDEVKSCDERPFIDSVLEEGDYTPHFVRGDLLGPLENVEEAYAYFDDGLISGNHHLVWALHQKAQAAGVRIMLGGLDGDNVVGHGILYLKELAEAGDWSAFASESKALAHLLQTAEQRHNFEDDFADLNTAFKQHGLARLQKVADEGSWLQFAREVREAHRHFGVDKEVLWRRYWRRLVQPAFLLRLRARRRHRDPAATPLLPLVNPAFAERIGMEERLQKFSASNPDLTLRGVGEREAQRIILSGSRIQTALELASHDASIHGLEVRHPFFDKRLVEFCLALPPGQSLKAGWTRSILRRALNGVLPDAIRDRVGKAWLGASFERGLYDLNADILREHTRDLGPLAPYVNQPYLAQLYELSSHASNMEQAQLARVATLACWLKKKFKTSVENLSDRANVRESGAAFSSVTGS